MWPQDTLQDGTEPSPPPPQTLPLKLGASPNHAVHLPGSGSTSRRPGLPAAPSGLGRASREAQVAQGHTAPGGGTGRRQGSRGRRPRLVRKTRGSLPGTTGPFVPPQGHDGSEGPGRSRLPTPRRRRQEPPATGQVPGADSAPAVLILLHINHQGCGPTPSLSPSPPRQLGGPAGTSPLWPSSVNRAKSPEAATDTQ